MKKIFTIALVLITAMAMGAENYEFQVGSSPELVLENISGDVTLEPGAAGEILIDYTKKDDRYEVDITQDGDRIKVKVTVPDGSRSLKGGVHFDIIFPTMGTLDVTTVSGDVKSHGISGDINLNTVSGNVTLSETDGEIDVEVVSGDIKLSAISATDVEASSVSGDVIYNGSLMEGKYDFNCTSGNVILEYTADSSFNITGRTVSGGIKANGEGMHVKRPKYGPGASLDGTYNGGDARVRANTVSGKVVLKQI